MPLPAFGASGISFRVSRVLNISLLAVFLVLGISVFLAFGASGISILHLGARVSPLRVVAKLSGVLGLTTVEGFPTTLESFRNFRHSLFGFRLPVFGASLRARNRSGLGLEV